MKKLVLILYIFLTYMSYSDEKCGTYLHLNEKINRTIINPDTIFVRPENQVFFDSEKGNFRIHFDTSGVKKVNSTDLNNNKIPDFVDSLAHYLEFSYDFYKKLGYLKVIPDKGRGGSNAIDVYLSDVSIFKTGYGFSDPEEIIQESPTRKSISYIVMDNDYSPLDSIDDGKGGKKQAFYTFGYDAFKITAAHELHHSIQYSYGIPINEMPIFMEMTSTFMESKVFSEINDNYQFLPKFFTNISEYVLSEGSSYLGYSYQIFFKFLEEKYGLDLIRRFWEISSNDESFFNAINSTLKEKNTSFNDEWVNFFEWLYFTNSRAIIDKYFSKAAEYPLLPFKSSQIIDKIPFSTEEGLLAPYQIKTFRFINNTNLENDINIIDFIITNIDSSFLSDYKFEPYYFKINNESKGIRLQNSQLYTDFASNLIKTKVFINGGQKIAEEISTIPNPVKLANNDYFYLKLTEFVDLNSEIKVLILNAEGIKIAEKTLHPISYNSNLCLRINPNEFDFSTGNYIAFIYNQDKVFIGKFSIIK